MQALKITSGCGCGFIMMLSKEESCQCLAITSCVEECVVVEVDLSLSLPAVHQNKIP